MRKHIAFFVSIFLCLALLVPCCALADTAQPAALNVNLTPILQAVIALLASLITCRLIPWIKARTTEQQQRNISALVNTLVYGAEQIYGAGRGDEKYAYVIDALKSAGYSVDAASVKAEIEAAVKIMQGGLIYPVSARQDTADNTPDTQNGAD